MTSLLNVPIPSISETTQNVARLLQEALAQAVQASDPKTVLPSDLELARSNIKALAFVQGVGLHGAYRYMRDFLARQAIPGTSSGKFLTEWLRTYKMDRKEAAAAAGQAPGTGVNGTVLAEGTLIQSPFGQILRTTADATVVGGVLTVQLIAVQVGAAGNIAAGTELTLVSSVDGIDPTFICSGMSGGADVESDPEALYRLIQRLSRVPRGGSPGDYAGWALALAGITRAWGVRNPAGPTSAGVIIMADNNAPYGLPTGGQQDQVYDYITDPRRGPPDELFVIIPTAQVVDVTLRLTPDTAANRTDAVAALKDLFFRESVPGGELPHSHLTEAISSIAGEYSHEFVAPALTQGGKFTATTYAHLIVLGTVTFVA